MLCLCSFFIYGCDNKKKISISTPEKDAKENVCISQTSSERRNDYN